MIGRFATPCVSISGAAVDPYSCVTSGTPVPKPTPCAWASRSYRGTFKSGCTSLEVGAAVTVIAVTLDSGILLQDNFQWLET